MARNGLKRPAVIVENMGWLYITRNGLRRSAMILEDLGWLKLTRNGLKRPGVAQEDWEWFADGKWSSETRGSPRRLGVG